MDLGCVSLIDDENGISSWGYVKSRQRVLLGTKSRIETLNLRGFFDFWLPPVSNLLQVQSLYEDWGFGFHYTQYFVAWLTDSDLRFWLVLGSGSAEPLSAQHLQLNILNDDWIQPTQNEMYDSLSTHGSLPMTLPWMSPSSSIPVTLAKNQEWSSFRSFIPITHWSLSPAFVTSQMSLKYTLLHLYR